MQRIKRGDSEIRSRKICSVPQCSTYGNLSVSLHKFPLDPKAVKEWKIILKIGKPISKYMYVCSKHFVADDFFHVNSATQRKRLKKGALPSQNLPVLHGQQSRIKKAQNWIRHKLNGNEMQLKQIDKQRKCFKKGSHHSQNLHSHQSRIKEDRNCIRQKLNENERQLKHIDLNGQVGEELPKKYEKCVQINENEYDYGISPGESSIINSKTCYYSSLTHVFSEESTKTDFCELFDLPQFFNTDEKLSYFTGVSNKIIEIYTTCAKQLARHNNIPEKNMKFWVVLVLCKLKTNLSFSCLEVLFGISNLICARMFYSTLSLLASSIKPAVYWPTKKDILKNMPKCFESFRNTRVVLNCIEVRVQDLKCLTCRILSYSDLKGTHTIKFLIGITPSGLISFISSAYGGLASYKSIFKSEKLITKFDPNDAIMADKDVMIEEECQSHCVKLIQSPFLGKNDQSLKEESTSTELAMARQHVERTIQSLKSFVILNDEIDWNLIPYINDIMHVISVTVNMLPVP